MPALLLPGVIRFVRGHTEGLANEYPVQFRDELTQGLNGMVDILANLITVVMSSGWYCLLGGTVVLSLDMMPKLSWMT